MTVLLISQLDTRTFGGIYLGNDNFYYVGIPCYTTAFLYKIAEDVEFDGRDFSL